MLPHLLLFTCYLLLILQRGVEWNINKSILCLAINHWILLVMRVDFTVTLVSIPNAERQIQRQKQNSQVSVCLFFVYF